MKNVRRRSPSNIGRIVTLVASVSGLRTQGAGGPPGDLHAGTTKARAPIAKCADRTPLYSPIDHGNPALYPLAQVPRSPMSGHNVNLKGSGKLRRLAGLIIPSVRPPAEAAIELGPALL